MLVRLFLAAFAAFHLGCVASSTQPETHSPKLTVVRAVDYLWSMQGPDGAWRSKTYGLLNGGESMTAFVLNTLLDKPSSGHEADIDRALDFLESRMSVDGALGMSDLAMPDYPNYATAMGLRAFLKAGRDEHRERMVRWLLGQQFTEQNGWSRDDAAYGAWGMGGARRHPPHAGHVDLSMTRHVLEALAAAGVSASSESFSKARLFVERCLNEDGGFQFSAVVDEANKAGPRRSYGTATADGLRAMTLLGSADASREWLWDHHVPGIVSGFEHHPDRRWQHGLWFYYVGSATGLLPDAVAEEVRQELRMRQRADGSWSNDEPLVKEDDPLIATVLALRAMGGVEIASPNFSPRGERKW